KDHRTIVYDSREPSYYINTSGNDGMATAGSGDVLTGITAALCAVMDSGFDAACTAVCLHGLAGDKAALKYGRGLTAGDIIDGIPDLLV
ncbi:MAG: bifunctional ADP-dependent NAD(P)H-hydrate dehydratase/NAD(P)H-hydrate epimerase, partial [Lachnospiraceae bacterium]|nr:bifunctional ADP-dependent NAD(P)H-hydrate dehydratase/NAD(P)H-hydrate epimerase [Lachnospiraceae bacterium]